MAKKTNAIYEPGELDKVRNRLGPVDESEARMIAQKLGGEIGTEKNVVNTPVKKGGYVKRGRNEPSGRKNRRNPLDIAGDNDDYGRTQAIAKRANDPSDDPSVQLKTSYFERIKMDRYASQPEFEIKTSFQALITILWFFGEPPDNLNPNFVNARMSAYYKKLELLVNATRALLPRNNAKRSERLKKVAPYYFSILDVIRNWNMERIDEELLNLRAQTRPATAINFAEVIRNIYRPLFILEKLNMETHIRGAYTVVYKIICTEDQAEPKEKFQEIIRIALSSFSDTRREVHFGLYPLLMKYISDRWFPYEQLFVERRRRFMSFLGLSENDQIKPLETVPGQAENAGLESMDEELKKEEQEESAAEEEAPEEAADPNDPQAAAKKAREEMDKKEKKAIEHSLKVLESLFPKAGWENLEEFPDLYPYFVTTYQLRRGYELIGPSDPLQQVAVLMHIMEDLCVGLCNVTFGTVIGHDGTPAQLNELMSSTITNWRRFIDDSFNKEYLPRLTEYCGMIEHSPEARITPFAKRTYNGLHWLKRLYFLPYYKFESVGPPPFQKQDVTSIYSEVRTLRRNLTLVAGGIEQGNRMGGAEAKAHCDGIENPWARYNFEIPNPVSKRIDALLPPDKRNNTALIFFALSVITVLDNLLNNENSWAYGEKVGPVFRSVNNLGVTPIFGIDNKLDADKIFKEEMKKKELMARKK